MKNKALIFPQKEVDLQNYYWFKNGFDDNALNQIYQDIATLPFIDAGTGDSNIQDKKIRSSKIKWIQQEVQKKTIQLVYIPSKSQLADIYTKPLPRDLFLTLRNSFMFCFRYAN
jgi:hypothetical protein